MQRPRQNLFASHVVASLRPSAGFLYFLASLPP
jgi:hypothetical protein